MQHRVAAEVKFNDLFLFGDGDILLFDYQGQKAGTKIAVDNELYGLAKGSKQVCLERDLLTYTRRSHSVRQTEVSASLLQARQEDGR